MVLGRRLFSWIAVPLLVAQLGCAARGVSVSADPRFATVAEPERVKCEAFAQEETKAVGTKSMGKAFGEGMGPGPGASGSLGDLIIIPLWITFALLGGTINAASTAHQNAEERDAAYARAMELCLAPALTEQQLGPDHPEVARSLEAPAARYVAQGKFAEAESLYGRALAIKEQALGPEAPDVATTLDNYAALLRKLDREAEAAQMEARAKAIHEKAEREELERARRKAEEAAQMEARAKAIYEKAEREELERARRKAETTGYIDLARAIELARADDAQGRHGEADALYREAIATLATALGSEHLAVAQYLEEHAAFLRKINRPGEAAYREARASGIRARHEQDEVPSQTTGTSRSGIALARSPHPWGRDVAGEPCASAVVSRLDELNERVTAHGGPGQVVAVDCDFDGTPGKLRYKTRDGQVREVVLSPRESKDVEAVMWLRLLSGAP